MEIICRKLSPEEFKAALALRYQVFVAEQKVPAEEEHDSWDKTAVHFGAFVQERLVGTGRVLCQAQQGKIGRLAVLKEYRGLGIGLALLNSIIAYCQGRGIQEVYLGAQLGALGFYEKAGFRAEGQVFADAGIPHRTMRKKI